MEDNLFDARLGVIDTIRGILLDLADINSVEEPQRADLIEQMGDVADMILDVLNLQIVSYDEKTNEVVAKLELAPIQ